MEVQSRSRNASGKGNEMVPRVSYQEFVSQQMYLMNRPFLVEEALTDWRIERQWTPKAIKEAIGCRKVPVRCVEEALFSYPATPGIRPVSHCMDFNVAAENIATESGSHSFYVMQVPVPQCLPELMSRLVVPEWVPKGDQLDINFWFGRKTVTPLHFDYENNFFAQVFGTKRFVLFPPQDSDCFYPNGGSAHDWHISAVDVDAPDRIKFPRFHEATRSELLVRDGQVLFLPSFWWHQVTAIDLSISISIWVGTQFNQVEEAPNALRELCSGYESDRLRRIQSQWLSPNGLSFLDAARSLLFCRHTWAAGLLTIAAIDEIFARNHTGVQERTPGCALQSLSTDRTVMLASAINCEALSASQHASLRRLPELAERLRALENAKIEVDEITSLICAVSTLQESDKGRSFKN